MKGGRLDRVGRGVIGYRFSRIVVVFFSFLVDKLCICNRAFIIGRRLSKYFGRYKDEEDMVIGFKEFII